MLLASASCATLCAPNHRHPPQTRQHPRDRPPRRTHNHHDPALTEPTNDPAIVALPHPIRVDLAAGFQVDVEMLRTAGIHDTVWPLTLLFQHEEEPLNAVLNRHIAFFNSPAGRELPGLKNVTPDELARLQPVIGQLAKIPLYLNLDAPDRLEIPARTDLKRKYRRLGPKLSKSRQQKIERAYDYILLGSRLTPLEPAATDRRGPRPHWRRGHIQRIRHGEKLGQIRIGWIQPTLVNAAGLVASGDTHSATKT